MFTGKVFTKNFVGQESVSLPKGVRIYELATSLQLRHNKHFITAAVRCSREYVEIRHSNLTL